MKLLIWDNDECGEDSRSRRVYFVDVTGCPDVKAFAKIVVDAMGGYVVALGDFAGDWCEPRDLLVASGFVEAWHIDVAQNRGALAPLSASMKRWLAQQMRLKMGSKPWYPPDRRREAESWVARLEAMAAKPEKEQGP